MQRILVVEDDRDIGELVCRYLVKAGFTAELVTSGAAGLSPKRRLKARLRVRWSTTQIPSGVKRPSAAMLFHRKFRAPFGGFV